MLFHKMLFLTFKFNTKETKKIRLKRKKIVKLLLLLLHKIKERKMIRKIN